MLHAIRAIFVVLCGLLGWWIGDAYEEGLRGFAVGLAMSTFMVLLELFFARRFIGIISVLMFGILIGFVVAHFLIAALYLIPAIKDGVSSTKPGQEYVALHFEFAITFVCSFISVIAILHTKDDLKFVIPFVELKREGGMGKPLLLDTSAIIDGRIADVFATRVVDSPVVVPRFVLLELQQVADSQDKVKRNRGRRGLDILNRLRKDRTVDVEINEAQLPGVDGVDAKLVRLAKMVDARIVTTDFNLNKVAQVQGVEVVNLNDIARALRPAVLQGEKLTIKVLRPGESPGQGVGYLDDGTMVVGEECAGRIGQQVELTITNILQTSAGRLIFGKPV